MTRRDFLAVSAGAGAGAFSLSGLGGTLLTAPASAQGARNRPSSGAAYIFAYFRSGESREDRTEKLHFAYSRDALNWYELNKNLAVYTPEIGDGILRDPFIKKGPDGKFHMVFTIRPLGIGIGYANSEDLVTFRDEKILDVMSNYDDVKNTWAPEWSWDPVNKDYFVYWASTVGESDDADSNGRANMFNDNKHYSTHTGDWKSVDPAKLFFDPGYQTIDANITEYNGTYYMFYKDETGVFDESAPPAACRYATSDRLTGGYGNISPIITPDFTEGPAVLQSPNDEKFYLYYDYWKFGRYGIKESADLVNWSDELPRESFRFPFQRRHGCFLPVKESELSTMLDAYSLEAHYEMDGGGRTVSDSSGNDRDGENHGATPTTGKVGGALSFDGDNDYVRLAGPSDSGFMHDEFSLRSVSMLIKVDPPLGGTQILYDEGGSTNGFAVRIHNGKLQAAVRAERGQTTVSTALRGGPSSWHHVVAVFNEGELSLYLDGSPRGKASTSYEVVGVHADSGGLGARFGEDAFGGSGGRANYHGKMDEVRIYSVPLQPEDVSYLGELYSCGSS